MARPSYEAWSTGEHPIRAWTVDPIPTDYEDIVIACYERVTMGAARGGLGPFFYRFNGPGGLSRS